MKKRIIITGAKGFTGRYVAAEAKSEGWETVGLVHQLRSTNEKDPLFDVLHPVNLLDSKALISIINDIKPDYVVHLAAIAFAAHGDVEAIYRTNVLGTRHLLEALAISTHRPKAVLLASSANVYGNSTSGILDETTPPNPANDYAVSKIAMEYVAQLYTARLPIIIARPFNYTGVGQANQFLIPKIIEHFQRRATEIELGNLEVARDFSDVRTVAACYKKLLETPAAIHGTFNVCSGRTYQLQDIIQILERLSEHHINVNINPDFVRANEVKILQGNRAKLESVIGQIDDIPFDETLQWMLNLNDKVLQ